MYNEEEVEIILSHLLAEELITNEEAEEIREYLYPIIDKGELDVYKLEVCFEIDYNICSLSYILSILKEKSMNNTKLNELLLDIEMGDLQVAFNVNLGIHVLVRGDGLDYGCVIWDKEGKIIKEFDMGFSSNGGYYSADDIAGQYSHLPEEYKVGHLV